MGIVLTGYGDAGYAHEGYAAQLLDDNSIMGAHSDESEPRIIGQVVAACDRGWKGTIRYPTTTGPFDENAERLALAEWEHTHAKPALRHLQHEGLTWHNPNTPILVEGPEVTIKPVGVRCVSAGETG
jgi:hypothetical protein